MDPGMFNEMDKAFKLGCGLAIVVSLAAGVFIGWLIFG